MSIPAVQGQSGAGSTGPEATTGTRDLGKQDFLMLLVAQLRNQDPLRPMDDTAFIAQLAQFNSLEQMQQLNQTLSGMAELAALGQAASLIGKYVTAFDPASSTPVQGEVTDVTMVDGVPMLSIGDTRVALRDVQAITSQAAGTADSPTAETA